MTASKTLPSSVVVSDLAALEKLAEHFWFVLQNSGDLGWVIYLTGDLGVGKTTFVRTLLRTMGFVGTVKSPTYTLVEPYAILDYHVYHFDLYRLATPSELEYIGFRDYFTEKAMCLVEWPEKASEVLPVPDLSIQMAFKGAARAFTIIGMSDRGRDVVSI